MNQKPRLSYEIQTYYDKTLKHLLEEKPDLETFIEKAKHHLDPDAYHKEYLSAYHKHNTN